ncbi:nuclease [Desulfonema ishimotonii]|uniref:Nuclease n=1 Tax=Desulfonema ishimotonii TaxID=45657 RepID=A0A401FRF5_9BACT|nr:thermonuclease family protein [Desulfonema ishimotonii]GBC59543.1 nuclease [Desulfonema ishimotonii]
MSETHYVIIIGSAVAALLCFMLLLRRGGDPLPERDPKCIWHSTVIRIDKVYDGDTFFAHVKGHFPIDKKPVGIRVRGVDTPEMKGSRPSVKKKAVKAKQLVESELRNARKIHLYNISMKDKYGRMLATVFCDRRDLGRMLIEKKLAKTYDGGKKAAW